MDMMNDSTIVQEVRQRAMEISARYDHDLKKYYEHLRQLQAARADRLVSQLRVVPVTSAGSEPR